MSRSIKRCTHQQNIFSVTDRAATGSGSRRGLARYIKRGNSDFELVLMSFMLWWCCIEEKWREKNRTL